MDISSKMGCNSENGKFMGIVGIECKDDDSLMMCDFQRENPGIEGPFCRKSH